jgi:hypothetical protein
VTPRISLLLLKDVRHFPFQLTVFEAGRKAFGKASCQIVDGDGLEIPDVPRMY